MLQPNPDGGVAVRGRRAESRGPRRRPPEQPRWGGGCTGTERLPGRNSGGDASSGSGYGFQDGAALAQAGKYLRGGHQNWAVGGLLARLACRVPRLRKLRVAPSIRVRINSNADGVDHSRGAVLEQLGQRRGRTNREANRMTGAERRINRKKWRKDVRYGLRPRVEITTFSFEQMSGDSVRAVTAGTAFVEITTKVAPCNRNLGVGAEAIRESRLANRYEPTGLLRHDAGGTAGRMVNHWTSWLQ